MKIKKINKKFFLLIFLFFLLLFYYFFLINKKDSLPKKACFENNCFDLKIADTLEKREKGLMFVESLPLNEAMLFIFSEPSVYKFWMKNTLISLDIIWINENKEIIFIENQAQPCQELICSFFGLDKQAKYVLEINNSLVKDLNIKIGDKVVFKY